jgi:hypothetical protein
VLYLGHRDSQSVASQVCNGGRHYDIEGHYRGGYGHGECSLVIFLVFNCHEGGEVAKEGVCVGSVPLGGDPVPMH